MVLEARYLELVRRLLADVVPDLEVWVFGSRVAGSSKPSSDLDLALVSESPVEVAKRAALSVAFEESDLPFRVDVVELQQLPPSMRESVLRAHEVIQQRSA